MTLLVQGLVTLTMIVVGLCLGLWIDLYRFLNRGGKPPLSPLLELLFWATTTAVVFAVLFSINHLELRFYVFFSLGLGLGVYYLWLSKFVLKAYHCLFCFVANAVAWLIKAVLPLAIPFRLISALAENICRLIIAAAGRFLHRLKENASQQQENPPGL